MKLTDISIKNLMRRKAKAGFIMAGLVVGVAAMVAVIGFVRTMTSEIKHKMERYGANILILPKTEDLQINYGGINLGGVAFDVEPIRQADLQRLTTINNAANIAATGSTLLSVVSANNQKVLLAGIDMKHIDTLKPWWTLSGSRPNGAGVIAGAETARILGLTLGRTVDVNGSPMTVVGILGAMNTPTTGTLTVDGIDVYDLNSEQRADFRREFLGFVFQSFHLIPYLTLLENAMLPLATTRRSRTEKKHRALATLERVGLGGKGGRLPGEASGGEKERCAIARAIVNDPPVLLANER